MNLDYAVERLYSTGWSPGSTSNQELETLPDGRAFPNVRAVQDEFSKAGLELCIDPHPKFRCCRASWRGNESGTVIGSCEREAAVFALAQLRSTSAELV
jgi:hypothetical protein